MRRAVNYSPAAPTCSASPRMLPRGSPPASQERDDVARAIMLLPLVGHGLAPPRPPADVQWRACFGSTSRTIRHSCRPGGLPTATSTILGAAERLLCESCAAELARARPRVHARAATVHCACCGCITAPVLAVKSFAQQFLTLDWKYLNRINRCHCRRTLIGGGWGGWPPHIKLNQPPSAPRALRLCSGVPLVPVDIIFPFLSRQT